MGGNTGQVPIMLGVIGCAAQFLLAKVLLLSTIVLLGDITDFMAAGSNLINEAKKWKSQDYGY